MAEKISGCNNEPLKIQFITDTHYYSRKGGTEGKAYDKAESKSQKVIKDTDLVIKAGFDMLCKDTSTDIVVLAGDTTRDGEIESHKEFIEMLRDLKKRGKRVYVITATHDFRDGGVADGYNGDETIKVPAVEDRHDLWDMYYEFGPNEAISTHPDSMSYVVQLAPGYRLFALNDDTNYKPEGERGSGFSDDCMQWIMEQLEDAKKNAALNKIENAEFYVGKAEEVLPEKYEKDGVYADVIVVDPPRKGCDETLLSTMLQMKPKRIVYVSCDSATLARDLKILCEENYQLEKVAVCDMFPSSVHVETVACLERK